MSLMGIINSTGTSYRKSGGIVPRKTIVNPFTGETNSWSIHDGWGLTPDAQRAAVRFAVNIIDEDASYGCAYDLWRWDCGAHHYKAKLTRPAPGATPTQIDLYVTGRSSRYLTLNISTSPFGGYEVELNDARSGPDASFPVHQNMLARRLDRSSFAEWVPIANRPQPQPQPNPQKPQNP